MSYLKKIIKYLENQDNRMKVIYVTVFLPVGLSLFSVYIYDKLNENMMWFIYLLQFIAVGCWILLPAIAIYDSLIKVQRKIRNKSEKDFDGAEFNKYVTEDVSQADDGDEKNKNEIEIENESEE